MAAILSPRLDVLPDTAALVGGKKLGSMSGGAHQHRYAGNGAPTREIPLGGAEEVAAAIAAARRVLPQWRALPANERRRLLLAVAALIRRDIEQLAQISVIDNGKTIGSSRVSPAITADAFEYYAGWADKAAGEVIRSWPQPALDYAVEEPYGVVGIIIPWNAPVYGFAQTVAPALAVGNCVVVKPPELAPYGALRLGELFAEAGFPPGVVTVIPGGPLAGEAMVRHPGIDKLHFTGSGATARKILAIAGERLLPTGLELGGKSANIVFEDADLDAAVTQLALGAIINTGQACIAGSRLLIQRSVYDDVVDGLATALAKAPIGDPAIEQTVIGPVITAQAADRILGVVRDAVAGQAGRLVTGGTRLDGDLADGYFVAPTLLADVDNAAPVAQHEIFGPVLCAIPFDDTDDAVRIANDTQFGLAGYLHTADLGRAHSVASKLECGVVSVNGNPGLPIGAPFGGVKQSGYGRVQGLAGLREFTRPKNVWIALPG
ncbi:aldehyde dehydrogenase family protein [Dactylosporangium sp. CA-092794]|uniref:aldehyde dehydrogenase family protein n=1 Tax=Dactylosporangium sp. CA-092794 TaxID=3239929 RepID=UPI003D93F3EB